MLIVSLTVSYNDTSDRSSPPSANNIACYSLVRIMLEDQLFQPQERPLVRHLLPNLHARLPCILRRQSCTARALSCVHHQCQFECLLKDGICQNFFLDSDFQLDSTGMGFRPDECGVDEADFHKGARYLLQTNCFLVSSVVSCG